MNVLTTIYNNESYLKLSQAVKSYLELVEFEQICIVEILNGNLQSPVLMAQFSRRRHLHCLGILLQTYNIKLYHARATDKV